MDERLEEGDDESHPDFDKEISMDATGSFINEDNDIKGSGTYVMRDGKLVEGKGDKREAVQFSNWYCSNADPEDLRKHRELLDR
jgi:hypothetical protein